MAKAKLTIKAVIDPAFLAALENANAAMAELAEVLERDDLIMVEKTVIGIEE